MHATELLRNPSSLADPSRPGSFNQDHFLRSLKEHSTPLQFKSKVSASSLTVPSNTSAAASFYSLFIRSPGFATWLHSQIDVATKAVRERYLARLEDGNVVQWAKGKSKAEVEDLLGRLEEEMVGTALNSTRRCDLTLRDVALFSLH